MQYQEGLWCVRRERIFCCSSPKGHTPTVAVKQNSNQEPTSFRKRGGNAFAIMSWTLVAIVSVPTQMIVNDCNSVSFFKNNFEKISLKNYLVEDMSSLPSVPSMLPTVAKATPGGGNGGGAGRGAKGNRGGRGGGGRGGGKDGT